MIEAFLPIQTVNEANGSHGHWREKARRRKAQRKTARLMCPKATLPLLATLTRYSAGTLDDDALPLALKSVRDGIADKFGIADNLPHLLRFTYRQSKCPRGQYGVRIQLTALEPEPAA